VARLHHSRPKAMPPTSVEAQDSPCQSRCNQCRPVQQLCQSWRRVDLKMIATMCLGGRRSFVAHQGDEIFRHWPRRREFPFAPDFDRIGHLNGVFLSVVDRRAKPSPQIICRPSTTAHVWRMSKPLCQILDQDAREHLLILHYQSWDPGDHRLQGKNVGKRGLRAWTGLSNRGAKLGITVPVYAQLADKASLEQRKFLVRADQMEPDSNGSHGVTRVDSKHRLCVVLFTWADSYNGCVLVITSYATMWNYVNVH